MIRGKRLISGFLIGIMVISLALTAGATDIKDMQKEQQELQNQKNEAAAQQKTLAGKVNQLAASMKEAERKLDQKRAEIEATEQELIIAKIDENDPNSQNVIDKLAVFDKSDDMIEKFTLKDEITKLPEREKKIILLRYFRGKTQSEVAEIMDISQVQISRIESKVIELLRKKMT